LTLAARNAVAAALAERRTIAAELSGSVLDRAARVVTVAEEGRLDAVGDEARAALAAMRQLLGNLRDSARSQRLDPQPTAAALDRLCAEHRAAGREVQLDRPPTTPRLPAEVDLSVHRVVEAALGAGDTVPARIRLDYGPHAVQITISGVPGAGAGPTLAGLWARVAAMGGRIVTDGVDGLRVSLPVPTTALSGTGTDEQPPPR
jgi:glucose-6-phosphate-specific signal transduction histidine kinase